MPRLNIYIPDDLDLAMRSSPHEINISKVCAAAIRAELAARSGDRSVARLFYSLFDRPDWLAQLLIQRYGLRWALAPKPEADELPRDVVAQWTAEFLNETVLEGLDIALGGGVQIWTTLRQMRPRNVAANIWAVGYGQVDHALPHAHPNALVTLLSLLYPPRSTAHLVGAPGFEKRWSYPARYYPKDIADVKRIVVGSCSPFDAESPYAQVLGKEMTDFLVEKHVVGDFLGVFLTADGRLIEPYAPSMTVSHIASSELQALSKRDDSIVILAAGGGHKLRLMRLALEAQLCNVVITDSETGYDLADLPRRDKLEDMEDDAGI